MYDKQLNRLRVTVNDSGAKTHEYVHGATVECVDIKFTMSVDELHDLRYLIDRAIASARPT